MNALSIPRLCAFLAGVLSLAAFALFSPVSSVAAPLAAAQSGAGDSPTLRCIPQYSIVPDNTHLSVDLFLADVSNLYGADIQLRFDPEVVGVVDADPTVDGVQIQPLHQFLSPDLVLYRAADNDTGLIQYTATQMNPAVPASGSGSIARIEFEAHAAGTSTLEFEQAILADRNGSELPVSVEPCSFSFEPTGTPIPSPTSSPVIGPGPAELVCVAEPDTSEAGVVVVDIYATDVRNLYGLDFQLDFDPSVLQVVDVEPDRAGVQIEPLSSFLAPDFVVFHDGDNSLGTIRYSATQLAPSSPVSGSGAVARATLRSSRAGSQTLSFADFQLADRNGNSIPASAASCTVIFDSARAGSTPTATVATGDNFPAPTATVVVTNTPYPSPEPSSTATTEPSRTPTQVVTPSATPTRTATVTPVPTTAVPTASPTTHLPTATASATLQATATAPSGEARLQLHEVLPSWGKNSVPTQLDLFGSGFTLESIVSLGESELSTFYINPSHLRALVPSGLVAGSYLVTINDTSSAATLEGAYEVVAADSQAEDLSGYDYYIWTNPTTPHVGEQVEVGVLVERAGGEGNLPAFEVAIYLGDPDSGGVLLGSPSVASVAPGATTSTSSITWTPSSEGEMTLVALIDPANQVAERLETNNRLERSLRVMTDSADRTAPRIDAFSINDGAPLTAERQVNLQVLASDPPSGAVASVLFVEHQYNQSVGSWIPVQASGWLPYQQDETYDWQLLPGDGVKYLKAWVADNAGNVVPEGAEALVNLAGTQDSLASGETRIFRYTFDAGAVVTIQVEQLAGDPDLYVWAPDWSSRTPWFSNSTSGNEQATFVAPQSGVYQIEVHAATAASYRLTVQAGDDGSVPTPPTATPVPNTKPLPQAPTIPPDNRPASRVAPPIAPRQSYSILLPALMR